MNLTTDKAARKKLPVTTGVLDYFPLAIAAVAGLSMAGNEQHNPGQPLHWDREKSTDHADCISRHLIERGTLDDDGQRHSTKIAWRALANLQLELEAAQPMTFKGVPIMHVANLDAPTAAEIGHAKDTQQRFLSGLEVDDRTTVTLEDQLQLRDLLESDVGTMLVGYDDSTDFEYSEAVAIRNADAIQAVRLGEFDDANPDYEALERKHLGDADLRTGIYHPDVANRDKCGTTDGVTPIPNTAFGFETPHNKPPFDHTFGFDLGLGDDGSYGVIVQRSVPKAEYAYTQKATALYGGDLTDSEWNDYPITVEPSPELEKFRQARTDFMKLYRERAQANLIAAFERSLWEKPFPWRNYVATYKPSRWRRFKSWVAYVFSCSGPVFRGVQYDCRDDQED